MPLRIVLANENRGRGGAERYTLALARALQAAGHRLWLACRPDSWLAEQGLPLVPLGFRGDFDPVHLFRARRLLGAIRPQIVHSQATRDLSLLAQWRAWFAPRVALVKSQHSFLDSKGSWWLRRSFRACDRVVPVSRCLQQQMLEQLGPLAFEVIPNALELPDLQQPVPDRLRQGPWLGYVGALLPSKRVDRVLLASRGWLAGSPERRLLIAGEGPALEALQTLAGELGILEQCWFPGYVEDPLPYLAGLQLLVHANPEETFSLVSLEAMALEVPVVACRAGGIAEVVVHGETGLLAEGCEPAALGELIDRYQQSPELRAGHGRSGRARVEAHFTWQQVLPRWEKLYQKLTSCQPGDDLI